MSSLSSMSELPTVIRATLDRLRGMIYRYVWMQAGILTAICGLVIFWIAGFIDYFPVMMGSSESPRWARLVMLVGLGVSMSLIVYRMGLKKWAVSWRDSSLALLLERRFPQFRHSLITTVQATEPCPSEATVELPRDPQLLHATQRDAIATIENLDLDAVMRWQPLQWQSGVLGGMLALSLLLVLWQPAWTLHWSKRLFGLSNAAWPRMSRLTIEGIEIEIPRFTGQTEPQRYVRPFIDGLVTMPRGQSGRLIAIADLTAKQVPETCMLTYRSSDSRQGRASLRRLNASQSGKLPFVLEGPPMESIDQPLSLSLQGGDVRIAGLRLDVIEAPQLNELNLEVRYPAYLRRRSTSGWLDETIEFRTGLRLPQGTDITLKGRANLPLERCECRVSRQTRDGETISEILSAAGDRESFSLPIGAIESNLLLEFRLWESSGHSATRIQQFVLGVIPDEPPNLDLVLSGIGSAITEQAILPIEAKVTDDHDVAESTIELFVNESPPIKLSANMASDGNVQQSIDLRLLRDSGQLKIAAGQSLSLAMVAKDYYDLGKEERIGRASPIQLGVVTQNQLLVLLERRELAMRSRMELIISELNQLHELLLKVRQSNETIETKSDAPAPETSNDSSEDRLSRDKLQLLRVQQSTSQIEKSDGELTGVENEIGQIRQELVNNRIDSQDRQDRLENRVRMPIHRVRIGSMTKTLERLRELEKAILSGPVAEPKISLPLESLAQTITALEAILQDMVDIQDFNEVIDMVRSMIDDQGKIIDKTKTEQKKRVLDLFK
ncbi:MAG: hypothetical protein SGI77_11610 [Pirellulaceae bacterium]|nr:hypothetical protein [Pirellulaceae bacterium]